MDWKAHDKNSAQSEKLVPMDRMHLWFSILHEQQYHIGIKNRDFLGPTPESVF